ncbi:hypothetical protein Daus18300_002464 [Diaporthe australafricana]|uniref:Mitochondrial carrier protein PET8 n=1 Tax=Diaporthe australafricana TaxID=127596 RepID=A0ABR3XPF8_9PEZI
MKRATIPSAGLRLTTRAYLQAQRPLHRASAASSPPAKGSTPNEDNSKQAQPAVQGSGTTDSAHLEKKAEPSGAAKKKTVAEMDEELRLKLEGMSGGGGSAGIEYENGKAEGLKRGVKSNMFRVI